MNIIKRLLGLEKRPDVYQFKDTQSFTVGVVGESNYQENLATVCGPRTGKGENKLVTAQLHLDDANKFDNQAVYVSINGLKVGHLSRELAPKYRAYLTRVGHRRAIGQCGAKIKGGWKRGANDLGSYGVSLDLVLA